MKLGDKPFSELTTEETLEVVMLLRSQREALRSDAVRRKAVGEKQPRAKRPPKEHSDKKLRGLLNDVFKEEFGK